MAGCGELAGLLAGVVELIEADGKFGGLREPLAGRAAHAPVRGWRFALAIRSAPRSPTRSAACVEFGTSRTAQVKPRARSSLIAPAAAGPAWLPQLDQTTLWIR